MRILLIEDSTSLCEVLTTVLMREKYEVQCAYDGEEGLEYALTGIYDLILLDVMMPKKDGYEVLRELRARHDMTPVIMLTALAQENNKVQGLDMGADDYLSKPFSTPELLARIRAVLRRRGEINADNTIVYQDLTLNLSNYELSCNGASVRLSQKECDIMRYFLERPRYVAEKEALINKVWGLDNLFESNSLEVFISFLRKKLAFIGSTVAIHAIRGVGYQLGPKQA